VKLPADTIIAADKLARYLLVPKARGDKSAVHLDDRGLVGEDKVRYTHPR
jgi:hypothetical protein